MYFAIEGVIGVGKTTLALNIGANVARAGLSVGIYSLEMSTPELMERLIMAEAGVNSSRIQRHELDADDVFRIGTAICKMSDWNLSIDETPGLSVYELATRAKKEKSERGMDLLIVDYLQLITPPKAESRVQEVSVITRSLKILAKEMDIPILALSQLSRQVEQRENAEPRLADLRDSGSIEQDSDQVIFLWWMEKPDPVNYLTHTQCAVSKNRHGSMGDFPLALLKEQSKFIPRQY